MIVEEIMNRNTTTLSPKDTIETALRTLAEKGIRHIPIVNNEHEVVGIISDRDVRDACPSILDKPVSMDSLQQPSVSPEPERDRQRDSRKVAF